MAIRTRDYFEGSFNKALWVLADKLAQIKTGQAELLAA